MGVFVWVEKSEESRRKWGRGNRDQDTLCEKRIYFHFKKLKIDPDIPFMGICLKDTNLLHYKVV